jgi:mRNA interferase MazF
MQKDFDKWNELKKNIEMRREFFCNTREIWWCLIGANIGAETSGKNELFERPVLIIRVYNMRSVLVAPITSVPKDDPYHVAIEYKGKRGWVILSHARTISPKRLQRKLYRIDKNIYAAVLSALGRLVTEGPGTKSAPVSRSLGARRPDGIIIDASSEKSMGPVNTYDARKRLPRLRGARPKP